MHDAASDEPLSIHEITATSLNIIRSILNLILLLITTISCSTNSMTTSALILNFKLLVCLWHDDDDVLKESSDTY